ncbi:MAG: sulfatase [Planctomycetaceae bacterium]|nr:sulfatase [Planctomycetaceae bacterium]
MRSLLLCLPALVTFSIAGEAAVRSGPPNVVLVLIDDMGWADLGCYGSRFHETPNIDRLASEGVRFTDFYAAGAVCSPTRASIQSGQYQARLQITDFIPGHAFPYEKLTVPPVRGELPLDIVTPAETLHEAGYVSGYFGKWHLGDDGYLPSDQGYDVSVVTGGRHFSPGFRTTPKMKVPDDTYLGDFLTDQTLAFIKEHRDQPFFVQLSHFAVHIPLEARTDLIEKYHQKPKPETGINNPIYAAMVEHVDDSVGRIMTALDYLDLAGNTLLIVTSDNGGLRQSAGGKGPIVCSNAPLRDEKGSLYEGGIRVPLIIRWPGVAVAGETCDEPTISTDFWATLADVAGVSPPEGQPLDGLSLRPLLETPDAQLDRAALYWHYPHYHHSRPAGAIRARDWKLIEFFDDTPAELYHLSADLSEEHDLAAEHPDRVQNLRQRLAAWRKQVGAVMPTPNADYDPNRIGEKGRRQREE